MSKVLPSSSTVEQGSVKPEVEGSSPSSAANFSWKEYSSVPILIPRGWPACYGFVHRRDGHVFIRNYNRPLKKGGLTFVDLVAWKYRKNEERLRKWLTEALYGEPPRLRGESAHIESPEKVEQPGPSDTHVLALVPGGRVT